VELLLVLLALAAGAGLPVQVGVNAAIGRHLGRPEWAAVVNFAVGLAALATWTLALRLPVPPLATASRAPWWAWTGGLLGAFYVTSAVILAPRLGVTATLALSVAGQMAAALALDHVGALGVAARPIAGGQVVGAVLLVAGVVLLRR
jgi:transporter family-2 protein